MELIKTAFSRTEPPAKAHPAFAGDYTGVNFKILCEIAEETIRQQTGEENPELALSIAWNTAISLPQSLQLPMQAVDRLISKTGNKKIKQEKTSNRMAQDNPAVSIRLREVLRGNIDDCRNPNIKSSLPVIEERYADHVEMLLNEVERLETALDRLAEEYIREKWNLIDENRELKEKIIKQANHADIFDTNIQPVKEHGL